MFDYCSNVRIFQNVTVPDEDLIHNRKPVLSATLALIILIETSLLLSRVLPLELRYAF